MSKKIISALTSVFPLIFIAAVLTGSCSSQDTTASDISPAPVTVTALNQQVEVPAGVSPELMVTLAVELERVVTAAGKVPSVPVIGVLVDDLTRTDDGNDAQLKWTYNNSGDYNMDGLVGVSDLTPIGIHYEKSTTAADWPTASCADGNGDGFITVGDITAIGQNYDNFVTNYVVEADINGDDTWVPVANVPRSNGLGTATSDWLSFDEAITNGSQVAAYRVFAAPEVPAGDLHVLVIDPNAFRVDLWATPGTGMAPLQVAFDVEFPNAVPPINFEINYGDGSAAVNDYSADGSMKQYAHTYAGAGDYTATVAATDADSDTDSDQVAIHVDIPTGPPILNPGYWEEHRVTVGGDAGQTSVAALIDGKPWIVYADVARHSVEFARATVPVPTGPGDWVSETIDGGPTDYRGGTIDLVECYGVACVVYEATTDGDMWFASSTDLEPWDDTDWVKHEPDWDMASGCPRLAVVDDHLAMIYIGMGGTDEDAVTWNPGIRYARAYVPNIVPPPDEFLVPPTVRDHWIKTEVDGVSGQFMDYLQLEVSGGLPVIAYQRAETGFKEVRYAFADSVTPDTTANWTTMKVDDLNKNSGLRIVMTLTDTGLPVLAYQNVDINEYLRYAIAGSAMPPNPGSWAAYSVYQVAQEDIGRDLSIAWYDGRPVLSHTLHTDVSNLFMSYPNVDHPALTTQWDHAPLESASTYFINGTSNLFYLADGRLAIIYRTSDGLTFGFFEPPA